MILVKLPPAVISLRCGSALNFYLKCGALLISIRALEIGAFQEADIDENFQC
jgi:hypothetical protein